MYVFAWKQGTVKSVIKTVKVSQPSEGTTRVFALEIQSRIKTEKTALLSQRATRLFALEIKSGIETVKAAQPSEGTMRVFSLEVKSGIKPEKAARLAQTSSFRGIASGDKETNYGTWFTPASTWMKNKSTVSKYDGNLFSVMAGGDFKLTENILIGTSVGYERLDLNTDYNDGTLKDNGFTFAPYFGYQISDYLIFDLILGYTYLDNDIDRNLSSERIKGSFNSHRFLISSNINYYAIIQNWNLNAVLGYMYVNEKEDAYREEGGYNFDVASQNIYLGEWRFGGRAGYFINTFEPYISAAYLYDNDWNNGGSDRDELESVLGCNYYPSDNLILSLEAANSLFRDDIENTSIIFNLHLDF